MTNPRFNAEKVSPTRIDAAQVFSLHRMRQLAELLGNPQNTYPTVHVAGSKGKGSICEMTASGLQGLGYRIGLYTSPDLTDIRERIRINGEMISKDVYDGLLSRVEDVISASPQLREVTHFERLTCVAFEYFRQAGVDAAVIEVGLGGRDDATNIITPVISVLGSIQLEHTQLLGNTLAEIALVKAGIMKPGVPAVSVPQSMDVLAVFQSYAAQVGSDLQILGSNIAVKHKMQPHLSGNGNSPLHTITLKYQDVTLSDVPVPLEGDHQVMNCAAALCAVATVASVISALPTDQGTLKTASPSTLEQRALIDGLLATPTHGRFEVVEVVRQTYILDTAHTPDSVRSLLNSVKHRFPSRSLITVFAVASDKDYPPMLELLGQASEACICTRAANHERGELPETLKAHLLKLKAQASQMQQLAIFSAPTLEEALTTAKSLHRNKDDSGPVVLITGSHTIVGEAMNYLHDDEGTRGT